MARNRKGRNRTSANVACDENELNKCQAQGMLAGSVSMGVAFVILTLTVTAKVPWVQTPWWAIFPVAVPMIGFTSIGLGFGAIVGMVMGRHVIYPTRMGILCLCGGIIFTP